MFRFTLNSPTHRTAKMPMAICRDQALGSIPGMRAARRANTLVLVIGILVLLVIIATAYVTRTQAGRVTAGAVNQAELRIDNNRAIGGMLADELAEALFCRELDVSVTPIGALADSNATRLPLIQTQVRYGSDPNFGYNVAPFHVVPFTNWPDALDPTMGDPLLPPGPGNPGPSAPLTGFLAAEGNPLGNPGFYDTRWLRDLEPLRWDAIDLHSDPGPDGVVDAFSHWRHLTNIARSDNGWRICTDISDIFDTSGDRWGELVMDQIVPVEQWLAIRPDCLDVITGTAYVPTNWHDRWSQWFGISSTSPPLVQYVATYANPNSIPPNFLRLNDLDANSVKHDWIIGGVPQDRPESEFVVGTARNLVSRILADSDGDGFTDSYWFLSPHTIHGGIRQVVALSIIDNCGMINANVALRFQRDDSGAPSGPKITRGTTPCDLALVGQLDSVINPARNNWKVGFYDCPDHDFHGGYPLLSMPSMGQFDYVDVQANSEPWDRHLAALNLSRTAQLRTTTAERLDFWRRCASMGLTMHPSTLYSPFTIADEIPLRMYHGQNYPWIFSRYQGTVEEYTTSGYPDNFMRGSNATTSQETNEYLYQLNNRGLLLDPRHRVTMYSAARNDIMPPWLWDSDLVVPHVPDPEPKIDLRSAVDNAAYRTRLHNVIRRAFMDTQLGLPTAANTYYGFAPTDFDKTEQLAAAYAANIDQARDADQASPLAEAIVVNNPSLPTPAQGFIGMERQPFLVEAFIGHVHKTVVATADHPPFVITGDQVVCNGNASTIVVVQIANPFDRDVDLSDFKIKVFGNPVSLSGLGSTTLPPNTAQTYYSIEDSSTILPLVDDGSSNLVQPWEQFLKLDQPGVNKVPVPAGTWSYLPTHYESGDEERAIELTRNDSNADGSPIDIIVDRIDIRPTSSYEFGEAVAEAMEVARPQGTCAEPAAGVPWDFVLVVTPHTHWVQFARVTRAWQWDVDGNGTIDADESNPRFIFPDRLVDLTAVNGYQFTAADYFTGTGWGFTSPTTFESKLKGTAQPTMIDPFPPVTGFDRLKFPLQMLQKDGPFDQVGELMNVWMYGHRLAMDVSTTPAGLDLSGPDGGTQQTFSEYLAENPYDITTPSPNLVGHDVRVNRLRTVPTDLNDVPTDTAGPNTPNAGMVVGIGDPLNYADPRHGVPALPAAVRMLDAFVCDGPDSVTGYLNAKNFDGSATPGLININTASTEVMRSLPHWYRLVHETGTGFFDNSPTYMSSALSQMPLVGSTIDPNARMPRNMIPEAIVQYRERGDGALTDATGYPRGPNYSGRGLNLAPADPSHFVAGSRVGRGMEAIGEVTLLTRVGNDEFKYETLPEPAPDWPILPHQWRIDLDMAPRWEPFPSPGQQLSAVVPITDGGGAAASIRIGTDTTNPINGAGVETPDDVAMDAEELNLLFSGASNMITTRSDTFTVYFRVRSFRQNTSVSPPVWDATNPDYIVDDSRYVMLVDRSNVNKPGDKPKILYFEKLPN